MVHVIVNSTLIHVDVPAWSSLYDESIPISSMIVFQPKKQGFRYPAPSRAGLLSMEFFEPGVFYYSDHNFEEAAEYIGTIIVKPKQSEHFVELTPEGFNPGRSSSHCNPA